MKLRDSVPADVIEKLMRRRLRVRFPDLDLTGLPPTFDANPCPIRTLVMLRAGGRPP